MATCVRCYLEPMFNGNNRVFLPDRKIMEINSSSLYDPKDVHLFRCHCTLSMTARYEDSSMSVKIKGIKDIYIDRKLTSTSDAIAVSVGSVIEINPGALIYVLEFSNIRKECINLSVDVCQTDAMSLRSTLYKWEMFTGGQLITCTSAGFEDKIDKVAAFDLDGTLIKSESGGHPTDHEDWTFWSNTIDSALAKLHQSGFKVIIFTNQAGLFKYHSSLRFHLFKMKIEKVIEALDVPVQVYIATYLGSIYRKPVPGMWRLMEWNCGVKADLLESFFVGDCAGRLQDKLASDRIFAMNVGVKFYTPEEFFLNEPPASHAEMKYHPDSCFLATKMPHLDIPPAQQELILMVGPPSCGKTFFVETYLIPNGYVPLSLDYFDDWNHSVSILSAILNDNKSCVVDHSNWLASDRCKFINLCQLRNIKVRCFVMDWSVNRCLHNNKFKRMFDMVYTDSLSAEVLQMLRQKFEKPTLAEGVASVVDIPFIPTFSCDELKYLYNSYLHAK